jgi:hypothetical protein
VVRLILAVAVLCGALFAATGCSSDAPTHRHEMSVDVHGNNSD